MANTQTLLLYFDANAATGKAGLFANNTAGNPSKVWIDQAGNMAPNDHLTIKFKDNVAIGTQIKANLPAGWQFQDVGGTCMRVTQVFWRNHSSTAGNSANHDSPFTDNNLPNGRVTTVFDHFFTAAQMGAGPVSALLGAPQLASGAHGQDRYIFVIAITVNVKDNTNAAVVLTASHDPQMDVGL